MIIKCIELNWLCKHTKKIRSSQAAILRTELSDTQLFPVSIVNTITRDVTTVTYHGVFILTDKGSSYTFKNVTHGMSLRNFDPKKCCSRIWKRSSVLYLFYTCSKIFNKITWHFLKIDSFIGIFQMILA